MEITTYEDLANAILALPIEQRRQSVQIAQCTGDSDEVIELLPGIALATVEALGITACRSAHDNKYHGNDVVLLVDHNPFAEDGAIGYELWTEDDETPHYGKGGPTSPDEQRAIENR